MDNHNNTYEIISRILYIRLHKLFLIVYKQLRERLYNRKEVGMGKKEDSDSDREREGKGSEGTRGILLQGLKGGGDRRP